MTTVCDFTRNKRPVFLWSSIPCTSGSRLQDVNFAKYIREQNARGIGKYISHWILFYELWNSFCHLADLVLQTGGGIAIEWPKTCRYWNDRRVRKYYKSVEFKYNTNMKTTFFDGCQYDLQDESGTPILKTWRVDTNVDQILESLNKTCDFQHKHAESNGKICKLAVSYTETMVKKIHEAVSIAIFNQTILATAPTIAAPTDILSPRMARTSNADAPMGTYAQPAMATPQWQNNTNEDLWQEPRRGRQLHEDGCSERRGSANARQTAMNRRSYFSQHDICRYEDDMDGNHSGRRVHIGCDVAGVTLIHDSQRKSHMGYERAPLSHDLAHFADEIWAPDVRRGLILLIDFLKTHSYDWRITFIGKAGVSTQRSVDSFFRWSRLKEYLAKDEEYRVDWVFCSHSSGPDGKGRILHDKRITHFVDDNPLNIVDALAGTHGNMR